MPDTFKYTFNIPATSGLTGTVSAFLAPSSNTTVQVFPAFDSGFAGGSFSMTALAGVIYPIKSSRLVPTTNNMVGFN
jgi:hypothetical protein